MARLGSFGGLERRSQLLVARICQAMGRWMIEEAAANRFVRSAPLCIAAAGRLDPEKDPETRSLRLVALRHSLCIELSGVPGRVRSSTTIPTLSIRLSAMCPIYKVSTSLTTDRFWRQFLMHDLAPARAPSVRSNPVPWTQGTILRSRSKSDIMLLPN